MAAFEEWPEARTNQLIALADGTRTAKQIAKALDNVIGPRAVSGKIVRLNEKRAQENLPLLKLTPAQDPAPMIAGRRKQLAGQSFLLKPVKVHKRLAEKPTPAPIPDPAYPEEKALEILDALFRFNASANGVENGPYADTLRERPARCPQNVKGGRCDLALKKGETRCAFHAAVNKFSATGYNVDDVYDSAPAESEICTRLEALKAAKKAAESAPVAP